MSVREMPNKKNRLTGKEICKVISTTHESVLIRPVLAIDVVLAMVGVLPIVANSTMTLTMTMTTAPVFHRYDSTVIILLGVESNCKSMGLCRGIFVVVECRRFLVHVGKPSLHVISLHLEKMRESTFYPSWSDSSISIQVDFCIGFVLLEKLCRFSGSS